MLEIFKLSIAFYLFLMIILALFMIGLIFSVQEYGAKQKEKEIFKEKYNKEINEAIKNLTDDERKEVLFIINEIIQEKKNKFKEKFQNLK